VAAAKPNVDTDKRNLRDIISLPSEFLLMRGSRKFTAMTSELRHDSNSAHRPEGAVMRLAGLSIFKFLNYLREELTIVLGTASSDAVLPQIMKKLERMGALRTGMLAPS
jgi:hypothetical protein